MSEQLEIGELRQAIRDVLADRAGGAITIPGEQGRGLDRDLWQEMAGLGWLALPIDEAFGGLGQGVEHLAVLYEQLGGRLAAVPALPTMLAATAIAGFGDDALKSRWLPAIAGGTCLAAVALPGDEALPAVADGALHGVADHVGFADVADLLLVPVAGPDGALLAVIPRETPGVTVAARPLVDLTRSMAQVRLDGVQLSAIALLAPGAAGWAALHDHAALGLACDGLGGCDALLEMTNAYLKIREQFGRPIGSFQALKHRMADWKVRIEAMRTLVRHAAVVVGAGGSGASAAASGAKAYACDIYAAFAGDAVQLHGGIGFTWEHPCHLFLKRAKLGQQLFGSGKAHKDRVAALLFDGPAGRQP